MWGRLITSDTLLPAPLQTHGKRCLSLHLLGFFFCIVFSLWLLPAVRKKKNNWRHEGKNEAGRRTWDSGENTEFINECSHQNYWKEKEEQTEHIYESEFCKAELSVNECRTLHLLLGIYFYLFCRCYFFQIFTDDFLTETHWQQARVSLSASYFSVLQTEKWKKSEER